MMKFIQWTLAVIGIIALALVATGFFLPSRYAVTRSLDMAAPPAKVYDSSPIRLGKMSGASAIGMYLQFSGPAFGQARNGREEQRQGTGSMEFPRVEPNRRIEYTLSFPEQRSPRAVHVQAGNTTKVTWTNAGGVGTNLEHYWPCLWTGWSVPISEGLADCRSAEKP
jgi:hypothetical protein